jgi:nicotinamidase/pyrazinamidase
VQNTKGAEFHPDLGLPETAIILSKGMDPRKDSYSAFQAENPDGKSFLSILRSSGITVLYVGGLATDYCVRHTVIDALESGFKVKLLNDAIRGVDEKDSR